MLKPWLKINLNSGIYPPDSSDQRFCCVLLSLCWEDYMDTCVWLHIHSIKIGLPSLSFQWHNESDPDHIHTVKLKNVQINLCRTEEDQLSSQLYTESTNPFQRRHVVTKRHGYRPGITSTPSLVMIPRPIWYSSSKSTDSGAWKTQTKTEKSAWLPLRSRRLAKVIVTSSSFL